MSKRKNIHVLPTESFNPIGQSKHEGKVLTTKEVMEGRSNAYDFIDFDKQEILEEFFNEIDNKFIRYSTEESEFWNHYRVGVFDGLKYQAEKMYSEEEVFNLLIEFSSRDINSSSLTPHSIVKWFEQFKKK